MMSDAKDENNDVKLCNKLVDSLNEVLDETYSNEDILNGIAMFENTIKRQMYIGAINHIFGRD